MSIRMQEVVARRTERAMEELILAAERTAPEKVTWHPMDEARTVLDLVQECARVNGRWAEILASREWVQWSQELIESHIKAMSTLPLAIQSLRAETAKYVEAIRSIDDDLLEVEIESPWATLTTAEWLMHALWHLSYHEGQINYIQTLYGDWSYGT